MSTMNFSAKDICKLIKTGQKAKIEELKVGDLYLSFRTKRVDTADLPGQGVKHQNVSFDPKAILRDELELRDSQVATLALENPMQLEEMLANSELETMEGNNGEDLNGQ